MNHMGEPHGWANWVSHMSHGGGSHREVIGGHWAGQLGGLTELSGKQSSGSPSSLHD